MSTRKKQQGGTDGPDIRTVMEEVRAAAERISPSEGVEAVSEAAPRMPPPVPGLDDLWDVWRLGPVQSHRGLLGLPIVLVKRALLVALRLHDRELLKRQRAFNKAVLAELEQLRTYVSELGERSGQGGPPSAASKRRPGGKDSDAADGSAEA